MATVYAALVAAFHARIGKGAMKKKQFPIGAMEFRMVFLSIGRFTIFRMIFCTQLAIALIIDNWVHNCTLVNKVAQILQKKISMPLPFIKTY